MTRLWLYRHARTDWLDQGRLNGVTDVELNEAGRAQAGSLRALLAEREWTGVWSSDLVRASGTAALAFGEPRVDDRLRELDFGAIEGLTWADLDGDVRAAMLAFDPFRAPRGESVAELRARLHAFIADLDDGDHLVFTHGGPIRALAREVGDDVRLGPCEHLVFTVA